MSSILDVARKAKVAPSTVSLVANGQPRVASATRKRVQSVMDEMGYTPRSARNKKRHIGVLYSRGLIISGEAVDYVRKWIKGIRDSQGDKGADVSVHLAENNIYEDALFSRALEEGDFDGIVLMGVRPGFGYLEHAKKANVAVVVMNQQPVNHEFSSVCADAYEAGKLAAEHLIELGHTRLANLFRIKNNYEPARYLRAGFTDTLKARNLPAALQMDELPNMKFDDPKPFASAAEQFLDEGITACFTGDPAGLRIADALAQRGVNVPQDFSVLGWDDLGMTTKSGKKLSSIGYDKNDMGLLAGRMLNDLLNSDIALSNLTATVPVELNDGETIGPNKAQEIYEPTEKSEESEAKMALV